MNLHVNRMLNLYANVNQRSHLHCALSVAVDDAVFNTFTWRSCKAHKTKFLNQYTVAIAHKHTFIHSFILFRTPYSNSGACSSNEQRLVCVHTANKPTVKTHNYIRSSTLVLRTAISHFAFARNRKEQHGKLNTRISSEKKRRNASKYKNYNSHKPFFFLLVSTKNHLNKKKVVSSNASIVHVRHSYE